MDIVFNTQSLKTAFTWALSAVDLKATSPYVVVKLLDKTTAQIYVTGESSERIITVPFTLQDTGDNTVVKTPHTLALSALALSKFASQMDCDEVALTYDDTTATFKGNVVITAPLVATRPLKPQGLDNLTHLMTVSTTDFFNAFDDIIAIDQVTGGVGTEMTNNAYMSAHPDTGIVQISRITVASVCLRTIKAYIDESFDQPMNFVMAICSIPTMNGARDTSAVDIYYDETSYGFLFSDGRSARVPQAVGEYSDISGFFTDRSDTYIVCDREELIANTARANNWDKQQNLILDVEQDNPTVMSFHNDLNDWSTHSEAVYSTVDTTSAIHRTFNTATLLNALKAIHTRNVRIHVDNGFLPNTQQPNQYIIIDEVEPRIVDGEDVTDYSQVDTNTSSYTVVAGYKIDSIDWDDNE